METFLSRYRNLTILGAVLCAQVLVLAFQVRRPTEAGPVRLARVWAVTLITPVEKAVVHTEQALSNLWHNYVWLRGVRGENQQLRNENERLRLEQIRLAQDAAQARRLQALLGFKEQTVAETVAAQVIGSSGSESSRMVYIDKGHQDGIRPDMAVITPDGVVGKVLKTFGGSSQVLLLTDSSSGAGALLEQSRLQGIVKGTQTGELLMQNVMSDEKVELGEKVQTSGGDRVFPKGLLLGTVSQVSPGPDLFLNIRVKPAAQIGRLEEVLVITRMEEQTPADVSQAGPVRAADVLAQRLPTVTVNPPDGTAVKNDPPSMAEWIRQQKLAEQAKQKQGAQPNAAAANPNRAALKTGDAAPNTIRNNTAVRTPRGATPPTATPNATGTRTPADATPKPPAKKPAAQPPASTPGQPPAPPPRVTL